MNAPYSSKALPSGAKLREWRLEEVLGVGGFGIVYRGRGTYFGEEVAIKEYFPSAISDRIDGETVKPTDSSSEEVYALGLQKFVEEAKILWALSHPERHPNIVNVRSLFEIHGTAYMVMDFESGISLSQMLREGVRFDETSLLGVLRPIAEGLDRAHKAGVIHRDIKPPNILVDHGARPVLIDFGSARFDSGQATSTKVTFYTPPYAALEQYIKTYPQGAWTDIYALGVVAYQCITGEKPPEVLERLHGEKNEPLASRDWPGFSRTFTRAVDAAMGIRPQDRPQSVSDWLKLFDAPEPEPEAQDEDATRIAFAPELDATRPARKQSEEPVAKVVPPPPAGPAAAVEAAPVAESAAAPAIAEPAARKGGRSVGDWLKIAGAVTVLIIMGAAAALQFMPKSTGPKGPSATLQIATADGVAAPASTTLGPLPAGLAPAQAAQQLEASAKSLAADARRARRPRSEISALDASASKIAALAAQARTPEGAAKAAELTGQMDVEASSMAKRFAAALERAGGKLSGEAERNIGSGPSIGPEAARAAAAVREARGRLASAAAAVSSAGGGAAAIEAARGALAAQTSLGAAYTSATPYFVSAKRAEFAGLAAQVRGMGDRIVAYGEKSKPSMFASKDRKQAYQTLKDNAARAKTELAQLDELTKSLAGVSEASRFDAALEKARALKATLTPLYEASAAADPLAK